MIGIIKLNIKENSSITWCMEKLKNNVDLLDSITKDLSVPILEDINELIDSYSENQIIELNTDLLNKLKKVSDLSLLTSTFTYLLAECRVMEYEKEKGGNHE